MLAPVKAHRPSGCFCGITEAKFSESLSPEDCEELIDCKKSELNWVNNSYAWMAAHDAKAIRPNASNVDGVLRSSVWYPSGQASW